LSAPVSANISILEAAFLRQRAAYFRDPYPNAAQRRAQLDRLIKTVLARQDEIASALDRDFGGRSKAEVRYAEILTSLRSLRHARRHLKQWMKSRPAPVPLPFQIARAWVMPQPLGVVGIVVPWNYPLFLTMGPIAAALAAGNRVMLKLSEFAPATSSVLAALFGETFPDEVVTVVEGDAEAAKAFVRLPFDHLLFTGSVAVGCQVMREASANLTPVTLELGGKSPVLVAADAELAAAAGSIVHGKFLAAGQTCIAPDYLLVPADRTEELVRALQAEIEKQYPRAAENPDYTSVINEKQYARLSTYLDEARAAGVRMVETGAPRGCKLPPTLVIDPPDHLRLMQEEIFGPILPIKPYRTLEDAIRYINERPRPLVLYLFTRNPQVMDDVLKRTTSGGVAINDTLLQIAIEDLPFGGVGASGMGHYHGLSGFETFSKLKPVFRRGGFSLAASLRAPYGRLHDRVMRFLIRWW